MFTYLLYILLLYEEVEKETPKYNRKPKEHWFRLLERKNNHEKKERKKYIYKNQ